MDPFTATALTYIAVKVSEKLLDKTLDNGYTIGTEYIIPKKTFNARLRFIIQKTSDEFEREHSALYSKMFSFKNSELLFIHLIEFNVYNSTENPLTVDKFLINKNIILPDQIELDEFFEIFMSNIAADRELRKLYIEEYYKEAIFEIKKSINIINTNLDQVVKNTYIIPQLIKDTRSNKTLEHSFNYRQRTSTFIGRENEITRLMEFFFSDNDFAWWAITGRGGVGKSRLALEFCIKLEDFGIVSGFLSAQQIRSINWNNWQPKISHLFVIDLAANSYKSIIELFEILANRKLYDFPIKIILIEREANGEWWSKLKIDYDSNRTLYSETPLNIEGLSIESTIEITKQIAGDKLIVNNISEDNLKNILTTIDPFKRPLFSMFIGIAIANGKHIRDWNQFQLLDFHLDYEYNVIIDKFPNYEQSIFYQHKNLLIISTICYGLNQLQLDNLFSLNINWLPTQNTLDIELYNTLAGNLDINVIVPPKNHFQPNKNFLVKDPDPYKPTIIEEYPFIILSPLLPDVLGEYFVLKNVEDDKRFVHRDINRLERIKEISYKLNSYYYSNFTRRILQDFPCHLKVSTFLKDPLGGLTNNRGMNGQFILMLMRGIYFNHQQELGNLWNYTEQLYQDKKKNPSKSVLFDNPNRVYQDATLLMIYHNEDDLKKQLYYYSIMRNISDEYLTQGVTSSIVNRDSLADIERFNELLSSGKEIDPSESEKWYKRNLVYDELIFQLEATAIEQIIKSSLKSVESFDTANLLDRLYELSCRFTDPRIKNTLLNVWLELGTNSILIFEEKLKIIYEKIKETPTQYQPMNIELEKCRFVYKIIKFYLHDINKVTFYFEDLMRHFQVRDPSIEIAFAFIEMAKISYFLFGYYFDLKQFTNGSFYAMRIKRISYIFGPNVPPEIQNLLFQTEQKIINTEKNIRL